MSKITEVIELIVNLDDKDLVKLKSGLEGVKTQQTEINKNAKKNKDSLEGAFDGAEQSASNLSDGVGGIATEFVAVGKAAKSGGAAMKSALVSTGVGILLVVLGEIVDNWEAISNWVTGVNEELERQAQLEKNINSELERRKFLNNLNLESQKIQEKEDLLRAKIRGATEEELTAIKRKGFIDRLAIAQAEADEANKILTQSATVDEETYQKALKAQEDAFKRLGKARNELGFFDLEQQLPEEQKKQRGSSNKREKQTVLGGALTAEEQALELEKKQQQFQELFDLETYQAEELSQANLEISETQLSKEAALSESRILIAKYEAEAKQEAIEGYASALSTISGVLGQETAAGKALAVASSLINTYAAINGQLKAFSGVPVPGYAIAQAVATGVAGFANVKKIISVKVPSYGGGGGNSIDSTSATSAPSFNVIGTSGTNQLAESLSQEQEPVQAYVVGSNVTTQQALDRNITDTATIG